MSAFQGTQVSVGTTPTPIVTVTGGRSMVIVNGGTATVFLGGANVSATTGCPLPANGVIPLDALAPAGATLYGIVATGTQPVGTLSGA